MLGPGNRPIMTRWLVWGWVESDSDNANNCCRTFSVRHTGKAAIASHLFLLDLQSPIVWLTLFCSTQSPHATTLSLSRQGTVFLIHLHAPSLSCLLFKDKQSEGAYPFLSLSFHLLYVCSFRSLCLGTECLVLLRFPTWI